MLDPLIMGLADQTIPFESEAKTQAPLVSNPKTGVQVSRVHWDVPDPIPFFLLLDYRF